MAPKKREISVVDRRLASGSVFRVGSRAIPLKEPKRWTLREVNAQINADHLYDMQEKGWVYASPDDLDIAAADIGFREQDGRLVKGQQGQIVLMKMAKSDATAVQKAKEQANRELTFSKRKTKEAILERAAGEEGMGDQAAAYLQRNLGKLQITDTREPAPVGVDD